MSDIHAGDIGTNIDVQIIDSNGAVDVSSASNAGDIQFTFANPFDTHLVVNGTFVTDGTDGWVRYETTAGDIDMAGYWHRQIKITLAVDEVFHTDIVQFEVLPAF